MDAIQRESAYHGKMIMDLNTNPDLDFEEKLSKITFRDMLTIVEQLPDKFLDLKYCDFMEMQLKPKEEAEALMAEIFEGITQEQENALEMLFETIFGN